jgi:S1-C subfamily serine protease
MARTHHFMNFRAAQRRRASILGLAATSILIADCLSAAQAVEPKPSKAPEAAKAAPASDPGAALGIQLRKTDKGEVLVAKVRRGSTAEKTGIRPGDKLLAIDGTKITSLEDANRALLRESGDPRVQLIVAPGNTPRRVAVLLPTQAPKAPPAGAKRPVHHAMIGASVVDQLGHVVVSQLFAGGPAAEAGLRSGDLIQAIDGKNLSSEQQLADIVAKDQPGQKVKLLVDRNGWKRDFSVTLGERSAVRELPKVTVPNPTPAPTASTTVATPDDGDWMDADQYQDVSDPARRAIYTDFDG